MKSTDCNDDMVWPQVGFPKHRRSACWAEMRPDLSPLLPVTDIDFGGALGANMLPLEIGTNAEHRTGSPLTLATMADAYNIRIGGYFDTQGAATAMRGSSHNAPPLSRNRRDYRRAAVRTSLLSIVLLAQKSLSGGFRGTTHRRCGGFAKQVAWNVEDGATPTLVRKRLEIRLNKNLDGLFAGTDLDMDGCITKVYLMASPVPSSNDS